MTPMMVLFCKLLCAHLFFDYAGQGDFMARAKNPTTPIPGVPWYQPMVAHCILQAGAVGYLTGSPELAAAELLCHCAIDIAKCRGVFGPGGRAYNIDQALHVACKLLWVLMLPWTR